MMSEQTENAGSSPVERRVRPCAWEVRQGARTFYVSDAEFVRSSYDTGSFTPLYGPPLLPSLPKPRVLASGTIAGKAIELRGWHTDDIEIWERQHGLKFGA